MPVDGTAGDISFRGCVGGELKSWVAAIETEPGDAFYGLHGSRLCRGVWILDVDGTRLMIATERSPGSPSEDIEELRTILNSIRIEP